MTSVFNKIVDAYLRRVDFSADGYARLTNCRHTRPQTLSSTPRGFGQPIFVQGGARLEDALTLLRFGELLMSSRSPIHVDDLAGKLTADFPGTPKR